MTADRVARIVSELSAEAGNGWSSNRICEVTRDVMGVSGAGVMLISGDVPTGSLCTTNDVSDLIEELQFTLGEGPCVDAYHDDRVVLEPDLAHPNTPRWLAFSPRAVEAGVRAVFAFPLQIGVVRLGALDLYRDESGPLTDDQHTAGLALADVIASWVLERQANAAAGALAAELEHGADFHYVVHNAAGAVSVQLGISIADAFVRLRAHAFAHDQLLHEVAEDVVARRLRLE